MTKPEISDIILKLLWEERVSHKRMFEKSWKKYLTNKRKCDIIEKLLSKKERRSHKKEFEKTWKKYLTNSKRCDIILKLSHKRERTQHLENQTMQEKVTTLEIPFWPKRLGRREKVKTRLKNAVITQALLNRIRYLKLRFYIYNFIKSLILAQDERWRHA